MTPARITMSSKGEIVIPAAIRKQLGLTGECEVTIRVKGRGIYLQPMPTLEELNELLLEARVLAAQSELAHAA